MDLPNDVILAYLESSAGRYPAGRMLVYNGCLYVTEDYFGILQHIPQGPFTDQTILALNSCQAPLRLATEGEIVAGLHLDLVPERPLTQTIAHQEVTPEQIHGAQSLPAKGVFHYRRSGMDSPVVLESYSNGKCFYDGNELGPDEITLVLNNLRNGLATISHVGNVAEQMAKSERMFSELAKSTPSYSFGDPQGEIDYYRKLHAANPTPEGEVHLNNTVRRYFGDHMMHEAGIPIGNRLARDMHVKSRTQAGKPNVVVAKDANNFKSINDTYGHDAGNQALYTFGRAMHNAAQKAGGKVFRTGGDEFEVHFDTPEQAYAYTRHFRDEMEQVPHLGGTHKLSMSAGIGTDSVSADKALYEAKRQKAGHSLSSIPAVLAHSFHPNKAGVVPTAPLEAQKEPPKPTPAASAPKTEATQDVKAPKAQNVMKSEPEILDDGSVVVQEPANPAPPTLEGTQLTEILKLFEKMVKKSEEPSKVDQIRLISESMVDFRRSGWKVKPSKKVLEDLGLEVEGEIEE